MTLRSNIPALNRTAVLGFASCLLALFAALLYVILTASSGLLPLVFVQFGAAVLGLLSGLAGMISSWGQGRKSILSIVGFILNLPLAYVGLAITAIVLFQRH